MKLTLAVGTKNWSSWSLRAWLPVKASGLPFTEHYVRLRQDDSPEVIGKISPSGLVPLLTVEEAGRSFQVWDSLAIAEFMAEIAPTAGLWPEGRIARAKARAVAAEMHAGFMPLRQQFSMEFARHLPGQTPNEGTAKAIARIVAVWEDCLKHSGGPFLFGETIGNADFFYAPVVSRFHSYDVKLTGAAKAYADAVWRHPFMREWLKAAAQEVAEGIV